MVEFFGREFSRLDDEHLEDLRNLETQGCKYSQFWNEDLGKFAFCRINFEPNEIVGYVDALSAYEEYLMYRDRGNSRKEALEQISNSKIKRRVKEYNEWAEQTEDAGALYCLAAFLGPELESLVCGGEENRYEYLQESYTGDRRFLLTEIFEGLTESVQILQDRDGDRPDFKITCEQDVQDILYAVMKPIFPDARPEEYTPKHASNSKRIDFVIPEISTVIEVKYVRDSQHSKKIPEELKIDIESYHAHSDCQQMYCLVWDGDSLLTDRSNFEDDMSGPRQIDGERFKVETVVLP